MSMQIERAFFLTTGMLATPRAAFGLPPPAGSGAFRRLFSPLGFALTPIACLVLEHKETTEGEGGAKGAGPVTLVDTGWSAAQCRDPRRELGLVQALFLGVRAKPGDDLRTQLLAHGIAPERVRTIVATHLHVDHVGGLADFPDAEVVTTDDELTSAKARGQRAGFDVKALARVGRFRMAPWREAPHLGFRRSTPLFGDDGDDGDVMLLDARGHTAGTLGVAVKTSEGTLVHVGDAAYTLAEAVRGRPSLLARRTTIDPENQARAYRAIADLTRAPNTTVVTSHDPSSWSVVESKTFRGQPA